MRAIFNFLTTTALRFWYLTLALTVLVLVAGVVAISQLNQELLPPIEFPQTIILSQVSGMSSEQALEVLTKRLEAEIDTVDEIVNIESTTTGSIGSIITALNDFGVDQDRLLGELRVALDRVWLPQRRIEAGEGEDPTEFAETLMGDLDAGLILYLAETDPNFLFQLSSEVWAVLSDETVTEVLAYLAAQVEDTSDAQNPLRRLVEQEIVPQISTLDLVANVQVSGGQELPGEERFAAVDLGDIEEARSLLLQLAPDVWEVVAAKAGDLGEQNADAVATLQDVEFIIPEEAPPLPESWDFDHFIDASDLLEVRTLTTPIAGVFNNLYDNGLIVGSLGQTNDLTPETVTRFLEIDPTLVQYFEAEHLVAMSPAVFDVLPQDFIDGLDGFTRDALAAAALAEEITGEAATQEPVTLPGPWRIQPPQLLTFSFADLPLASFSIFSNVEVDAVELTDETPDITDEETTTDEDTEDETPVDEPADPFADAPEGPALPALYTEIGTLFGAELDTADDLLLIELSPEFAELSGSESLRAAEFFNLLLQLNNFAAAPAGGEGEEGADAALPFDDFDLTALLPALGECGVSVFELANPENLDFAGILVGCLDAEAVEFLIDTDPDFAPSLQTEVFTYFDPAVLALPEAGPPLADVWDALSGQPQFADRPLDSATDVITIGDGSASSVLNAINDSIPEQYAGYEVRLFNSLNPTTLQYFSQQETDFYSNLDEAVLRKFSPEGLSILPEDVLASLDDNLADELTAIASGEANSAFDDLRELYASDVPAADPDAPVLNDAWSVIGDFLGVELDTTDDFFRFYPDAEVEFLNSFFDSAQGISFAPNLYGGLSLEAIEYMVDRDPNLLNELRIDALQLLDPAVLAELPESVQERAASGGERFTPDDAVTRVNGASSLLFTVFKEAEANTVEAHYDALAVIEQIEAENPDLTVSIAFEQASFIEDSITGVAREGTTGAIFAMVIILVFLSGGRWDRSPRQIAGIALMVIFAALMLLFIMSNLGNANGDFGLAFAQLDVIVRVLVIFGFLAGLGIMIWPGSLPLPAWRATLVIGVSIPLSVFAALALMNWLPPVMNSLLSPYADSPIIGFLLRLFPESLTLNIMTLSGLTVAVGRIVDDSIVVLENSFRRIQAGGDKKEAITQGVRDVSSAIFVATLIAVVVFLPLGLTGGLIGEFFLPFGLAVTYALLSSFLTAIIVIPVLMFLFINTDDAPEDGDIWLARYYLPILKWSLSSGRTKTIVLVLAVLSMIGGFVLFGLRPAAFLPEFGELQMEVSVTLPSGTSIIETNTLVGELETTVREIIPEDELGTLQVIIGGGGLNFESLFSGGGVSENVASVTISVDTGQDQLDQYVLEVEEQAIGIFGEENVDVSLASLSSGGGFGGFELVVSGPIEDLETWDSEIIAAIETVEGISNVTSDLTEAATNADGPVTYLRVDQQPALGYGGELDTDNTIGVTSLAIEAIEAIPNFPDTLGVSQGFASEIQTEGFFGLFIAMGIAIAIVVIILVLSLGSPVYWLAIILSIVVAPVGAAVALTLADRVLGISALIGLLMLIGLVITNAVVLIDRVRQNNIEYGLSLYDSLVEAGGRRLRPILMTALATIIALIPLAIGLSEGALIASELGTVVIGGIFSSTLLTLIVVPVAYSVLTPLHLWIMGLLPGGNGRVNRKSEAPEINSAD